MILKYLDIEGFKSFPDKTRINFGKGLTAIVGPNGSGKSNISDAVAWVMGEQSNKSLRSGKMEDVIFSGTLSRKPLGYAEVSLTVDNTDRSLLIDSDEVVITRRYDRLGESEYMINKSPVRLKDLQEMLMDTGLGKDGYSLVGQGKISEIVDSKPDARREIFEEAAGIAKFRHRKKEAERSLERAEDNLTRLRDILLELESRIEPLKEQSEKAKRFLDLSSKKKTLEISIWVDTLERSNRLIKDQNDKILVLKQEHQQIEDDVNNIEQQIKDTFTAMQKCIIDSEELRKEKSEIENKISEIKAHIAVSENNIERNNQDILRIESEIEGYLQNKNNILMQIEEKNTELELKNKELTALKEKEEEKQYALLEYSAQNDDISKKESELTETLSEQLLLKSQTNTMLASYDINLNELSEEIKREKEEESVKFKEIDEQTIKLEDVKKSLDSLNDKAQSLTNTYNGYKIKFDNRAQKLEKLKNDVSQIDLLIKDKTNKYNLLKGMEQSLEGYSHSVKEVIKSGRQNMLSGIVGTVSQIIEVSKEYSVALETALGAAVQNIVVENESNAKAAIRYLKAQNLGRATFLPISSIKGNTLNVAGLDRYAGYIDIASNLITVKSEYKPLIDSLLGRTVVVDDIDTAVLIAQKNGYKFKIVTLDGQIVNAGGSLTGGSQNKNFSFLSRKNDIIQLESEIKALSKKFDSINTEKDELENETKKIEADVLAISAEITTLNEDRIRFEGEITRLEDAVLNSKNVLSNIKDDILSKENKLDLINKSKSEANEKISSYDEKIARITVSIEEIKEKNREAVENKTLLAQEISDIGMSIITVSKDIEVINNAIELLRENEGATGEQTDRLKADIALKNHENADILTSITEFKENISESSNKISEIENTINELLSKRQSLEKQANDLRNEQRDVSSRQEQISAEIARLSEKERQIQNEYDSIIENLWNEYEMTKSEAEKESSPIENLQKANSELSSLRGKIRAIGNVNVDAIEEYKEVSERYEFLNGQIKDTEKSKLELIKLINDLTANMQEIFSENFKKINDNFKQIFIDLFGGGTAELSLTDPNNILESGIEISVEPPGKIINNLAALSGGERSFIAIAIYFAILKVRPAPFCVLDEIEAALDEINVDKYASYLKLMSDNTQFIMITHRRGSMEAADILYGVTMQDNGVSKVLKLDTSDIESKYER